MPFCLVCDLFTELSTYALIFAIPHSTFNNSKKPAKCRKHLLKRHMFQSFLKRSVQLKNTENINGLSMTSMSRAVEKCQPKIFFYEL